MKLLMSGASPFVRKVLVVLRETQQLDDVEIVSVTTAPGATPAAGSHRRRDHGSSGQHGLRAAPA
mgnify:CR=1 FL=1